MIFCTISYVNLLTQRNKYNKKKLSSDRLINNFILSGNKAMKQREKMQIVFTLTERAYLAQEVKIS